MNEAAARRALRDLRHALDALDNQFVIARRRLRELESEGYGRGGTAEGSIGGGRHGDPTARAVLAGERIRRDDDGNAHHAGWRTRDQFEAQRHRLETELRTLVEHAQNVAEECSDVLRVADPDDNAGDTGCELCEAATYRPDAHKCDAACRDREHKHPDRRQDRYSATAPRTPARVHACAPPRLAVVIDGTTDLALVAPRLDSTYTICERTLTATERQYLVVLGDNPPAGARPLCRVNLLAFAPHVIETDLVNLPTVADVPRCSWHYEFAERYGIDAASDLTIWHLEHPGQRVPNTLVRDTHPHEFARHHDTKRATA